VGDRESGSLHTSPVEGGSRWKWEELGGETKWEELGGETMQRLLN